MGEQQSLSLCDDMKLLKILEQERAKKAKLVAFREKGFPATRPIPLLTQRGSLKRKRREFGSGIIDSKQKFARRKEGESSSD